MIKHNKFVHEVVAEAASKRSKADKIKVLQENNSGALYDILRGTYDDRIVWLLPTGAPPPYTPNEPKSVPSNLLKECKKLAYLVKGAGYDDMLQLKRERIFIGILESIHPKDAELLVNTINKKPIKGVTKATVKEAFPDLLP